MYFSDFNEGQVSLDVDVVIKAGVLDEFVKFWEMFRESFVWINNCELGSLPWKLSSFGVEIPDGFGNKEVVICYFSVIIIRGNVEESISSVEIKMDSITFWDSGFPWGVIEIGIERTKGISPCLIESFNFLEVILLSHSDD